jgi:hypothetical protein
MAHQCLFDMSTKKGAGRLGSGQLLHVGIRGWAARLGKTSRKLIIV